MGTDPDKAGSQDLKLSFYFRHNRINIGKRTMEAIGMPDYIHLLVSRKKKYLFIKPCKKDKEAFNVYFTHGEGNDDLQYRINEKPLLKWLGQLAGIESETDTVQFSGIYIPQDNAVCFNLREYSVISHES